ncbi:hypothetical protein L1K44_09605 [Escherichia coli]|nr:hypothetical protein [Escherichia coli]
MQLLDAVLKYLK